jgi:hypothetical protein
VNLDALAQATRDLDEAGFLAKFPLPALIFKPPQGDTNPGPDLETDQYALPGPGGTPPKPRETMGTSIVLFLRSQKGEPFVSIGRGREADIALPLGNVSRVHALFSAGADGHWSVTDNRSTNGTFLNDQRLPTGATSDILDGAWIRFGADAIVKFYTPLGLYGYLKLYRSTVGE